MKPVKPRSHYGAAAECPRGAGVRRNAIAEIAEGKRQCVRSHPAIYRAVTGDVLLYHITHRRLNTEIALHETGQTAIPEVILTGDEQAVAGVEKGRQGRFACGARSRRTRSLRGAKLGTCEPDHDFVLRKVGDRRFVVRIVGVPDIEVLPDGSERGRINQPDIRSVVVIVHKQYRRNIACGEAEDV